MNPNLKSKLRKIAEENAIKAEEEYQTWSDQFPRMFDIFDQLIKADNKNSNLIVPYERCHTIEFRKLEYPSKEIIDWCDGLQELNYIWRFDHCAPMGLKDFSSKYRYCDTKVPHLPYEIDMRSMDIAAELQYKYINLVKREWLNAYIIEGFPVEFRVYILDTEETTHTPVISISNYYPQRPIVLGSDRSDWYNACFYIDVIEQITQALYRNHGSILPKKCTLDFIIDEASNEPKLLEINPPFTPTGGSHPTCFNPAKLTPWRRILAPEEGSVQYKPINRYKELLPYIKKEQQLTNDMLKDEQMLSDLSYYGYDENG
jgi:hypothetical protein